MDRKSQINGWYIVAAVIAVLAFQQWWIVSQQAETIPYSQFEQLIDSGKIQSVRITDKYITGTLDETLPDGRNQFVTVRVDPALAQRLAEHGISVEGEVQNNLIRNILSWIIAVLVFFGIWAFFIRRIAEKQGMGGLMTIEMTIGKSKAKVFNEASTGATDDLNKATDIARNMVARFGMDDKLGLVTYETPRQTFLGEDAFAHFAEREFSEDTACEIDRAVRQLTSGAFEKALSILRRYRSQLERGAKLLLEKETLTRDDLPLLQELQPAVAAATGLAV